MTSTEERTETLEKQVRRQRRWNIALGVLVISGGLMAAKSSHSVPDVIQAKKFEVVNDAGKILVELSNLKGNGVDHGQLVTRNSSGGLLVILDAGSKGGWITTQNGKGQTLVQLGATVGGQGLVMTENGKGQKLVSLGATSGGSGSVLIKNGRGLKLVELSSTNDGNGSVQTLNGKGVVTSSVP